MNPQKNQDAAASPLLRDLQAEVSAENAPLLQFIVRHASAIVGVVLLLLLALGGTAVWNWYHGGKRQEAREELARITMQPAGRDRIEALRKLAENAPESARLSVYLSLGKSARESGDLALAADAYARAASLDDTGALGLTAALGAAGSLLMQDENAQALAMLKELQARLPEAGQAPVLRQMLAEAAARAGETSLAMKTYEELGRQLTTPDGAYFRARAQALADDPAQAGAMSGE